MKHLYINNACGVFANEIVGIFDVDNTTRGSNITNEFLFFAQENIVDATEGDIPRSFVVCENRVVLTAINSKTLAKKLV